MQSFTIAFTKMTGQPSTLLSTYIVINTCRKALTLYWPGLACSTSAINGEQDRPLPVSIQTFMTVLCGKDLFTMVFYVDQLAWHSKLNLDWFQPFTRRKNISIGAIYIAILNLPREDRYKLENVILLGIIPNLTKEPSDLEYFLRPLVEEPKTFYRPGIHLPRIDRVIRCALICITCDLPATRKVCGYVGHSAKLGCSRCLLDFGGGQKKDVSRGWSTTLWRKRTQRKHHEDVAELRALGLEKRAAKEKKLGVRYSPFLDLEYY